MTRILALALLFLALPTGVALGQVKTQKKAEGPLNGQWYGSVELRHHINTYFDQDGYYARQSPSLHARAQVGAQFYGGALDAYATLGAYKLPETQQVLQRRPELALDFYPFRNQYLTLLQYSLVQLPYEKTRTDPDAEEPSAYGTVYTIGFAPTVKGPLDIDGTKLELKAGLDGWTKLYSQQQYLGGGAPEAEEEDEPRFSLLPEGEEPMEDYAPHYRTQEMAGLSITPFWLPALTGEATVNLVSRFDPIYTRDDEDRVDYHYGADRYSYYRLRFTVEVTERISIMNDFYHFHDGFFAAKRFGEDERRYRNIARITCKL